MRRETPPVFSAGSVSCHFCTLPKRCIQVSFNGEIISFCFDCISGDSLGYLFEDGSMEKEEILGEIREKLADQILGALMEIRDLGSDDVQNLKISVLTGDWKEFFNKFEGIPSKDDPPD